LNIDKLININEDINMMEKMVEEKKKIVDVIKKTLVVCVLLLAVLVVVEIILINIKPVKEIKGEGSLGTMGIFSQEVNYDNTHIIKNNCSDENLKAIWDYAFKEGSEGIVILAAKNTDDKCDSSLMYKILENNMTYFAFIEYKIATSGSIEADSVFFYGNFSENIINALISSNVTNYNDFAALYLDSNFPDYTIGLRNISDIDLANDEYHNIFKIDNGSWESLDPESYNYIITSDIDSNYLSSSIGGAIFSNNILDYLYYTEIYSPPVNITQRTNIPDFVLNASEYRANAIDLGDYFNDLKYNDSSLNFSYSVSPEGFEIEPSSGFFNNFKLDFNASSLIGNYTVNITLSYPKLNSITSNNFNVSIVNISVTPSCTDSDGGQNYSLKGVTTNSSESETDVCYNSGNLREFYCGGISIMETNFSCASDSHCSDGACILNNTNNDTNTNNNNNNNHNGTITVIPPVVPAVFKISNPLPAGTNVSAFKSNKTIFSISNTNYDSIKWYLDSVVVKNSTNFFEASNLSVGNHTVKVEIRKGTGIDSWSWTLNVKENEKPKSNFNVTVILFWIIIVVILIIGILFTILIIIQKGGGRGKIGGRKIVSSKENPVLDLNPAKRQR